MKSMSDAAGAARPSGTQQGTRDEELSALRQIRESARALLAEGRVEEAFEFVVSALDAVLRKTRDLELLVAKLRRQQVGKRSERIDPAQLQLLFEVLSCRASDAYSVQSSGSPLPCGRESSAPS